MKYQRGYTLLEVIVAFALLALALGLLLGTLSGGVRQVRAADAATRASLHAQSLLAEMDMQPRLAPQHRQGKFEQGRYSWQLDVRPWVDPRPADGLQPVSPSDPVLLQVDLAVRWGSQASEQLHWRSLRLVPPAQPGSRP
ncbi:MAG TPA: prepilin-type N-terminal cleavage/methylation domain-containing protein [Stenotrophomonas sp.]|nr:prepilin-type N-terminal cleavage/methylation domain-containing protein [Stenotrophomonas sp.]